MKKPINYDNIKKFKTMRPAMTIQDAVRESSRCLLCEDAPCSKGCPAGTDPGKFIRQIRFLNYKGAARTIRNNNAFGHVCAFTCPVEKLCEKECSNKLIDDPINIAGLQRFACEYGNSFGLESCERPVDNGKKIAVIGAGPSGIACATKLASLGYQVTVFEKENEVGGVPLWNIPSYRLPKETIDNATRSLKDLGVNVVFGKHVSEKDEVKNIIADGFKACFISTGLSQSVNLPLLIGYQNVASAKDFLKSVKLGTKPDLCEKNVAVVGGGSVAMDAAVTAKSLGAKKVYAISLEGMGELPADEEEIELALGSHVVFKPNSQITNVVGDGKNVTVLKGVEIEWIKPNNFSPSNAKSISGTGFDIKVDYVISAIGAAAGEEIKEIAAGLKQKGRGVVAVADDFSTDMVGVFAGGDISNGGSTIAKAVGDGKKAAESIHNYLTRGK